MEEYTLQNNTEKAVFAGGCFWCMVKPFDQWDGVISVVSGYTGGHVTNPTYEHVKTGTTGHYEAVEIIFDPATISYTEIVKLFWQQIDPTDDGGQFQDRGEMYRTAIFYTTKEQQASAEQSKKALQASGRFTKPIVTPILRAQPFYPAEEYHQDFYKTHAAEYEADRKRSGRDPFIHMHWNESS